ncbi:MAG: PEP-CTERM sorting domain-containing protein [Planctomycetota bacterium]
MRQFLLSAAISFLSCSPLLASTYQYTVLAGYDVDLFFGDAVAQPFASEMVFQWEAEAGNVFVLNSQSESLQLLANLGMYADFFDPRGIFLRDITVSLGGASGQITISSPVITENVPLSSIGVDQFVFNSLDFGTISGVGTFSSISFALTFDGAGAGQLGVPFVSEDRSTATPYPPVFYVQGSGAGYLAVGPAVVPEPSTYAMALAGIACGGFSMWRRRKRA